MGEGTRGAVVFIWLLFISGARAQFSCVKLLSACGCVSGNFPEMYDAGCVAFVLGVRARKDKPASGGCLAASFFSRASA